jgi:hypothetical protein
MGSSVNPETTPAAGYTPPAGSLEEASSRLMGLLSDTPSEDQQPATAQPEQAPPKKDPKAAPEPEQAPAAPDAESNTEAPASEPAKTTDESEPQTDLDATPRYTVKVDGQDVEVTLEEALKGYSRTQDYTRKTQQVADERKQVETLKAQELAALAAERQQLKAELDRVQEAVKAFTPSEPDWELRKLQVPAEQLAQEVADWQRNQKILKGIEARRAELNAKAEAEGQAQLQRDLAAEHEKLQAAIPDFADPEKAAKVRQEIVEYAVSMGIPEEVLNDVRDHRYVVLLHKAMAYDRAQHAKPKIANKIEQTLTTAKPGNRNPAPKPSKLEEAKSRLQRTGRVEDAAAALMEII